MSINCFIICMVQTNDKFLYVQKISESEMLKRLCHCDIIATLIIVYLFLLSDTK